jgi:superfamily II DNA helicase RecQ
MEMERAAALAAEIDAALGREQAAGMVETDSQPSAESSASAAAIVPNGEAAATPEVAYVEEDPADDRVLATLGSVFGYESLLPGQAAVINRVLARRDTLAILPT